MPTFRPAYPHGTIEPVFPDVFMVQGSIRILPGVLVTRNMTIVRQGGELTLINSVRLSEAGEAELEKLGKVAHVVRIGANHGADDPYFVDRFRPKLWAPPRTAHNDGAKTDEELVPGSSPIAGSTVFAFTEGQEPEACVLLEKEGGILVSCDSYQHWINYDGCSPLAKLMMVPMGFQENHIGGPWLKRMGLRVKADFDRLVEAEFQHVIPGHGVVQRQTAKAGLRLAMKKKGF